MAEEPTAPQEEFAGKYSIITVGDAAVGKTCLAQRFTGMKFNETLQQWELITCQKR